MAESGRVGLDAAVLSWKHSQALPARRVTFRQVRSQRAMLSSMSLPAWVVTHLGAILLPSKPVLQHPGTMLPAMLRYLCPFHAMLCYLHLFCAAMLRYQGLVHSNHTWPASSSLSAL